jgi:hypothetical protein
MAVICKGNAHSWLNDLNCLRLSTFLSHCQWSQATNPTPNFNPTFTCKNSSDRGKGNYNIQEIVCLWQQRMNTISRTMFCKRWNEMNINATLQSCQELWTTVLGPSCPKFSWIRLRRLRCRHHVTPVRSKWLVMPSRRWTYLPLFCARWLIPVKLTLVVDIA